MFLKSVFVSGEMLNMLNMLNAFKTYRPLLNEASKFQKRSTYSTYSTFPLQKNIFGDRLSNIFNIFNISAERNIFGEKCLFQL